MSGSTFFEILYSIYYLLHTLLQSQNLLHTLWDIFYALWTQISLIIHHSKLFAYPLTTLPLNIVWQAIQCLTKKDLTINIYKNLFNFSKRKIWPPEGNQQEIRPFVDVYFDQKCAMCIAPEILKWQSVFLYNLGRLNDFIGQKCLKLKLRSTFVPTW